MKILRWKVLKSLASVGSLGTIAAAVACSSGNEPQNLTSQYEIALRTLTKRAEATGDYRGLMFDAYYGNLKKGQFVKLLMKNMRFDENGMGTANFDPFVEILSMLNPKTTWSFTSEEENKLLDGLYSYLFAPMGYFLENNIGILTKGKQSVILDEKNSKPLWKLEIDFPYGTTKRDGSKFINDSLDEGTADPAYTNGYLATEFGLLSLPTSIRPFKKAEGKSASETALLLMKPLINLDMYGYILKTPDLEVRVGSKYTLWGTLQFPPFLGVTYPIYADYSDANKNGPTAGYEITFKQIYE